MPPTTAQDYTVSILLTFCAFRNDTVPSTAPEFQRLPDTPPLRRVCCINFLCGQDGLCKGTLCILLACSLESGTCHPCRETDKERATPDRPGLKSGSPPETPASSFQDRTRCQRFLFLKVSCCTLGNSFHIDNNHIRQTALDEVPKIVGPTRPGLHEFSRMFENADFRPFVLRRQQKRLWERSSYVNSIL